MGSTGNASRTDGFQELAADPLLYVAVSVAEVSADAKAEWAFAPVPPGVDGGDRHVKEVGEILCREQRFKTEHAPIVRPNPVISLSFDGRAVANPESDIELYEPACNPVPTRPEHLR